MSPLLPPRPRYHIFSSQISSSVYPKSTIFSRIGKANTVNAMRTETFFYSNGLWFNRNSNILVKARCSHIRKIFIKSLHLKHIYAKTFFPNTPQDSFYSQYMYQMCHNDIRSCRCMWPFVGNRGDIFTLSLVFQCSLQVSNYNELAFWFFFWTLNTRIKYLYKNLSDSKMFCFSTCHVEKVRLIIESPSYHFTTIWMRAERNFHQIWITMEKSFVITGFTPAKWVMYSVCTDVSLRIY